MARHRARIYLRHAHSRRTGARNEFAAHCARWALHVAARTQRVSRAVASRCPRVVATVGSLRSSAHLAHANTLPSPPAGAAPRRMLDCSEGVGHLLSPRPPPPGCVLQYTATTAAARPLTPNCPSGGPSGGPCTPLRAAARPGGAAWRCSLEAGWPRRLLLRLLGVGLLGLVGEDGQEAVVAWWDEGRARA